MSLFNFRKKPVPPAVSGPYADASNNFLYHLLFCDRPEFYQESGKKNELLQTIFSGDVTAVKAVADDDRIETRLRLLAVHRLRALGEAVPGKELFGVIVEVGMDGGLDTLASYKDGSARYINHTGRVLIWETNDPQSDELTIDLFEKSRRIIDQIGPWTQPRLPAPPRGSARISFLVSDGLYFGEAGANELFTDPLTAPALMAATRLMQYLTTVEMNS